MPTVAVPQMSVTDLDPAANLARVERRLADLPDRVAVACFPEYALTGFVADDRLRDAALTPDDPHLDRLADAAAAADTAVLAGYVERRPDDGHERGGGDGGDGDDERGDGDRNRATLHNAAVYVRPDGERVTYRKRHLWGGERDLLTPGTERCVFESPFGRTAVLTCYDLNFVAESAALTDERVDCLLVPGAWPAAHSENWRLLLRARALDGVRWVVGAGRTGRRDVPGTDPVEYAGRSAVVRPDGAVAAALNRDERDLLWDLDPDLLAEQRAFVPVLD
jgi:predicted amidohydrolase